MPGIPTHIDIEGGDEMEARTAWRTQKQNREGWLKRLGINVGTFPLRSWEELPPEVRKKLVADTNEPMFSAEREPLRDPPKIIGAASGSSCKKCGLPFAEDGLPSERPPGVTAVEVRHMIKKAHEAGLCGGCYLETQSFSRESADE